MYFNKKSRTQIAVETTMGVLTALIILAVAGVAIAALIVDSNQNSLQRFCITATMSNSTANTIGAVSLKTNEREIEWDLQYMDLAGLPIRLQIRGPVLPGMDSTGTIAVALCGTPSSLVCDTSQAGVLKGKIDETSSGNALKPIIQAIRKEPWKYYVKIDTTAGEELRDYLTSLCGTP